MTVTESYYCVTAAIISEICGQSIRHEGAWNLVQQHFAYEMESFRGENHPQNSQKTKEAVKYQRKMKKCQRLLDTNFAL
jgi:hypothetical protein